MTSRSQAAAAADVFQRHRDELGFVNRAQCEEKDLYTIERDGEVVGAALGNHCVRKPQTTLYELAVLPEYRREGIATELIRRMASESPHDKLVAKCPVGLPANEFYATAGWTKTGVEDGKNRDLNIWEYSMGESVDIITTGRPDLTAIAGEYGYLRGTRLDDLPRYERAGVDPAFIDMHWEDPDFDRLLTACRRHEPAYAVAGDYDDEGNHNRINERARQLRAFVENVIVVPHYHGDLAHVPEWAVIGYSTPSDYAATEIPLRAYRDADQPVHILGGTPHQQHELLSRLWLENVQSMDCNSHHKAATIGSKAWHPVTPHWRQAPEGENRVERAYEMSIENLRMEHEQRGLIDA